MHDLPRKTHAVLCILIVVMQAACVAAPALMQRQQASAAPTKTKPLIVTAAITPTPYVKSTPTSFEPSATPIASEFPNPSATMTIAPFAAVKFVSLHMMDVNTGWAVADVGSVDATRILRTADGGITWTDVNPVEGDQAWSYFLDGDTAWTGIWGSESAWRTLDGGHSWSSMEGFGGPPRLGFVDSQQGWKLDAVVWGLSFVQFDIIAFSITQDGGLTWQEVNPPPGRGVAYMAYPSAQMAWAIRAGFAKTIDGIPNLGIPFHIEATLDGGATWTTRQMPLPPEATLVERSYEGDYLGGVGNCQFFSPVYSSTSIWKLALTCELESWMYTSANQGKTWIISEMPAGLNAGIQFIDALTGWLFIGDPYESPEGHLYQTTNGGQSWTLVKRTGWTDAYLSFVDAGTGWAMACSDAYCYQLGAQQALIKTNDGGKTWQTLHPQLTP